MSGYLLEDGSGVLLLETSGEYLLEGGLDWTLSLSDTLTLSSSGSGAFNLISLNPLLPGSISFDALTPHTPIVLLPARTGL